MNRRVMTIAAAMLATATATAAAGGAGAAPAPRIAAGAPPEAAAMNDFVRAWDKADPEGLSQLFEQDGKLVIPTGNEIGGRETIKAFYAVAFQSGYRGSRAGARVARVTRLGNSLSLVEGGWSIKGAKRPNGSARPAESGRFSAVVRESGQGYRLVALSEVPLGQ